MSRSRSSLSFLFLFLFLISTALPESGWYQKESEHFTVIYRKPHAYLVPHILQSAETSLSTLKRLFNYSPSERIVIRTGDFADYGSASATSVPHNFIRLEIEPLEPGYENIPYNERIQWLIAHELIHIVVNDRASHAESLMRSLFSKVPPEKDQPLSIFYSLLTNSERYTPRWHQEGIAVFMETWLSGGFGRTLGNFDEMYFRSLVQEGKPIPGLFDLVTKTKENSFLLDMLDYLYGARFTSFLASTFGTRKLLDWYSENAYGFYKGYRKRFKTTFGMDLRTAWAYFREFEERFQKHNLKTLASAPLTPIIRIQNRAMGWVTKPYLGNAWYKIIFGHHQPHHLTSIKTFDFKKRTIHEVGSLPTPSIIQVASIAYDKDSQLLFYSTNNNRLYRDIRVLNLPSKKDKLLFKDCRVGDLTISPQTHELWGVRHSGGKAALVYSAYPYRDLKILVQFDLGDVIQDLSVSPSGRFLAATLHQASGRQAIIVADVGHLKKGGKFTYRLISEDGSPEFPAWSADEAYLYWNAYTNGVSNIYRYDGASSNIDAMSHTLRGLFRPLYLNERFLFAFEFSSDGFIPVVIPNEPATHLPAIDYYGQKIIDRTPELTRLTLTPVSANNHHLTNGSNGAAPKPYSGLAHLQFHSIFPVISGFRDQKVVGVFTHFADPLFLHDFVFEIGATPFDRNPVDPRFHFRGKYEYKRTYRLELEHNGPSFYDLFNQRKAGMIGTKATLGHTHYWKYDIPHKIKQTSDLTFYTGVQAINDNLIAVSNPDFFTFETSLNSQNFRRAIGSVDKEFGNEWTLTAMVLGVGAKSPEFVQGGHAEWSRFLTWLWPHNVLHLKLAAGYLHTRDNLAIGKFYFGGFGNRYLENKEVKQFRDPFRFPGIPIYSVAAEGFGKVMVEHNLPPLRFNDVRLGLHFLSHLDASWFVQGLLLKSNQENKWVNVGGQINFVFNHWYNLETTFSAGVAQAWSSQTSSREWFVSFKLLRN